MLLVRLVVAPSSSIVGSTLPPPLLTRLSLRPQLAMLVCVRGFLSLGATWRSFRGSHLVFSSSMKVGACVLAIVSSHLPPYHTVASRYMPRAVADFLSP